MNEWFTNINLKKVEVVLTGYIARKAAEHYFKNVSLCVCI